MKYYFEFLDAENCYLEDHFYELMKENKLSEMKIYPAKMVIGEEYFWCDEFGEVGESGDCCGKFNCAKYIPRNGKNGRCKHHRNTYEPIDQPIIIKDK